MAYRGVNLHYFRDYGIETIEDLVSMEGNFLLDILVFIEKNQNYIILLIN